MAIETWAHNPTYIWINLHKSSLGGAISRVISPSISSTTPHELSSRSWELRASAHGSRLRMENEMDYKTENEIGKEVMLIDIM